VTGELRGVNAGLGEILVEGFRCEGSCEAARGGGTKHRGVTWLRICEVEFAEEGHGAVTIAGSCNSNGDGSGRRLGGFRAQGEVREVLSEAGVISRKSSLQDVFIRARVKVHELIHA